MEKNGQLTFSDDSLLSEVNGSLLLLESGDFAQAAARTDVLLTSRSDYPGLAEAFRSARYWQTRMEEAFQKEEGIDRANFMMDQWMDFTHYAEDKKMMESSAFAAVRKFVFYTAAEHFKIAFHLNQAEKFGNLLNLGICFMNLGEFRNALDTFEYARSSIKTDAKLISLLAEAYYQTGDIPKSMLNFREAFFIDPTSIDMTMIHAKPIVDLIATSHAYKPEYPDPREWVSVIGHITDIFYVKRQINMQQLDSLRKEVYNLERSYQALKKEIRAISGITPRLISRYLWLFDYYSYQSYNFENSSQIRNRLMELDKDLFLDYFKNLKK